MNISVIDTGIGISEEGINKLFIDFSKLDENSKRNAQGTGLGLSICKNIIEQMPPGVAPQFRSCGGPGAGGLLIAPADDTVWMPDPHFRVAVARRLGGHVQITQGNGNRLCQHVGPQGLCSRQLDGRAVHARTCPAPSRVATQK